MLSDVIKHAAKPKAIVSTRVAGKMPHYQGHGRGQKFVLLCQLSFQQFGANYFGYKQRQCRPFTAYRLFGYKCKVPSSLNKTYEDSS